MKNIKNEGYKDQPRDIIAFSRNCKETNFNSKIK